MQPGTTVVQQTKNRQPKILVVDDEPGFVELVNDVVEGLDCKVTVARTLAQAKKMLAGDSYELLLTDLHLPDGDGMSLLPTLRRHHPCASAIIMTGAPSVEGAVSALRSGAVDFVAKPFDNQHLIDRVRKALDQQSLVARQEKRLVRLRDAVKRLGTARRLVSKKVDLLCNDLVSAYGELSRQLDGVRTQENFRKHIDQSKDLEQLLCHTMDWLLRQLGYANVALWLAGDDGEFQLGAYMKYSITGDDTVASAMQNGLLPGLIKDGFIHATGEDLKGQLEREEYKIFSAQDIVGLSCTYLGESLAAIIFFRDGMAPFNEADEATLKAIGPIFATALATVVRDPANEVDGEGDGPYADDEPGNSRESRKRADDWWKRGEPPPF
jgi:FixJ family two-component response regulator